MALPFSDYKTSVQSSVSIPQVNWQGLSEDPRGLLQGTAIAQTRFRALGIVQRYVSVLEIDPNTEAESWYVVDMNRPRVTARHGYVVVVGPRQSWPAARDEFATTWATTRDTVRLKTAIRRYGQDVIDDPVDSESQIRAISFSSQATLSTKFDQDVTQYVVTGTQDFSITAVVVSTDATISWELGGRSLTNLSDISFLPRSRDLVATVVSGDRSTTTTYTFALQRG